MKINKKVIRNLTIGTLSGILGGCSLTAFIAAETEGEIVPFFSTTLKRYKVTTERFIKENNGAIIKESPVKEYLPKSDIDATILLNIYSINKNDNESPYITSYIQDEVAADKISKIVENFENNNIEQIIASSDSKTTLKNETPNNIDAELKVTTVNYNDYKEEKSIETSVIINTFPVITAGISGTLAGALSEMSYYPKTKKKIK